MKTDRRTMHITLALFAVLLCCTNAARAQTTPPVEVAADPAAHDPFCSVDVEAASGSALVGGTSGGPTTTLIAHLRADGASAGAHLVIFSSSDAYVVDVPALALSGSRTIKNTAPFEITFPKPIDPKFIYVDSSRLDGSAETACPTEPREFKIGKAANPGSAAIPAVTPQSVVSTLHFSAKFVQALPPVTCGSVYDPASVRMAVAPNARPGPDFANGSVTILAYVDASGRPVKAYVLDSSVSKEEEDSAKAAALMSTYVPERFYCTPVPGSYVFKSDFQRTP
jgi:hypothetical protein